MNWLNRLRRRLALRLWPSVNTTEAKRHLERVARECGVSQANSRRLASKYFASLHDVR
jgi:hypothetical protein